VTETKDPVNAGYSANGKPARLPEATTREPPSSSETAIMAWATSASTTRWGLGKDAVMHRCCRWRLPAVAVIAKPTSDAGASSQEESIDPQSLRFAPRRVPTRSDPALSVR